MCDFAAALADPRAPASLPVPRNITRHDTGLRGCAFVDFDRVIMQGLRKDGSKLDPFMPIDTLSKMNEIDRQALWAYLGTLAPRPFGQR